MIVQSKKSGLTFTIDQQDWQTIKAKGEAHKYRILSEDKPEIILPKELQSIMIVKSEGRTGKKQKKSSK